MSFALSIFLAAAAAATPDSRDNPGLIPGTEQIITGRVISISDAQCVIDDGKRPFAVYGPFCTDARPGDTVEVDCQSTRHNHGGTTYALHAISRLGSGTPPSVRPATVASVCRGEFNLVPVRIRGLVEDISVDEVDPDHHILILRSGPDTLAVPLSSRAFRAIPGAEGILRAEVEVTGICYPEYPTIRFFKGQVFMPEGRNAVKIVRPAPSDAFNAPPIPFGKSFAPAEITSLGLRTVCGKVIAVWGVGKFLVEAVHGPCPPHRTLTSFHHVDLPHGIAPPAVGETVQVLGQPETDTYWINLSRASWRTLPESNLVTDKGSPLALHDVLSIQNGRTTYDPGAIGHIVHLQGVLSTLPIPGTSEARMHLLSDGVDVPLDASACPEALRLLHTGDTLDVSGICLFEIENWRPSAPRPKIQGFFLAIRSPDDIVVLSRPSWWTNGRLSALVAGLLALLAGVLVWNRSLNRLALKRGRELADEQIERTLSELKVGERTRLAVELHDSLSQNLAGVACQVGALKNVLGRDPAAVQSRVRTVERMLQSTRSELRNCLFDLRSNVMDDPDMANAIRRTLDESEIDAEISVRFDVPRERLLDSTAHAILSIVRELAGNAVRHGRATRIRVAGSIDNGHLLFSVRDNGCGFDPDTAPGLSDGHFGLDGIRNRASGFNGTFTVSSSPGHGTRAVIDIPLPPSFLNDASS